MAGGYVTVRPKKRVWPKVVGGLVVLIVLILGIGVAVAIFGDHAPPALDDYMHGKGVSYRSTDRQVIVRMPKTPEIQPVPGTNGSVALTTNSQYEMLFFEIHPGGPTLGAAVARSALRGSLQGGATAASITVKGMTDTTFQGHLAVHGTGTTHGDQVELLAFYAHKSEYGLIVHTKKGASDVMRKFEESVQVSER